uniref:Uncharacterized protein n=1 Tax=Spongospora subterranea TaxID=70186 RepID=A0A0H5RBC5_9EUKA|eukprot:CRZ11323.1 hypothetical protein [Spongospora subterranea]
MGCDGGSIPGRKDLVKQKKSTKAAENVVAETASARWQICAISQTRLQAPIVVCRLGRLYNKEALIQYLIQKQDLPRFSHIRSLKDVVNVNYAPAPKLVADDINQAVFMCPVTLLLGNGKYRFHVSISCGCMLSERAINEISSANCLLCHATMPELITSEAGLEQHFISVNPSSSEEQDRLRMRMEIYMENNHHGKHNKKKRKHGATRPAQSDSKKKPSPAIIDASTTSEVYASLFTSSKVVPKITNTLFGNV